MKQEPNLISKQFLPMSAKIVKMSGRSTISHSLINAMMAGMETLLS